jgi:hypothetical protein
LTNVKRYKELKNGKEERKTYASAYAQAEKGRPNASGFSERHRGVKANDKLLRKWRMRTEL